MHRRTMMAGLTACLAVTGSLAVSAMLATPADAWSRKGSVTGPRGGTTTWERSGSCEGGTCTRSKSVTGPAGQHAVLGEVAHLQRRDLLVQHDGDGARRQDGDARGDRHA